MLWHENVVYNPLISKWSWTCFQTSRHNAPYCIMGNMISIGLTCSHSCRYMVRALCFLFFNISNFSWLDSMGGCGMDMSIHINLFWLYGGHVNPWWMSSYSNMIIFLIYSLLVPHLYNQIMNNTNVMKLIIIMNYFIIKSSML